MLTKSQSRRTSLSSSVKLLVYFTTKLTEVLYSIFSNTQPLGQASYSSYFYLVQNVHRHRPAAKTATACTSLLLLNLFTLSNNSARSLGNHLISGKVSLYTYPLSNVNIFFQVFILFLINSKISAGFSPFSRKDFIVTEPSRLASRRPSASKTSG